MVLKFKQELCIGCRLCQLACSGQNEGVFNPDLARLKIVSTYTKTGLEFSTSICSMCLACVDSCPVDAISCRDGHLVYAQDQCTGCGACVTVCPEQVIASRKDGIALCNLCGGVPVCVEWCPHQALLNQEGN